MSKGLIERLLDNRVTGFNLTVAAVEAADLIEAQAAQIKLLRDALESMSALGGNGCVQRLTTLDFSDKGYAPF